MKLTRRQLRKYKSEAMEQLPLPMGGVDLDPHALWKERQNLESEFGYVVNLLNHKLKGDINLYAEILEKVGMGWEKSRLHLSAIS